MARIFVTRKIPEEGIALLQKTGHEVTVSSKEGTLTQEELMLALKEKAYDAVLCTLNNTIDAAVMDAAPSVKMYANFAVGFNNIDVAAAKQRGIVVTNTPGVLTDSVAEHTFALILALAKRLVESDRFTRQGKYEGWGPMLFLGTLVSGKKLGLIGAGRIGARVAEMAACFGMHVSYFDIARNESLEALPAVSFEPSLENLLQHSDIVSVHVPLTEGTHHLLNAQRLALLQSSALLVNTSRGAVIDEVALVEVLRAKKIAGAALDVFEHEPALAEGLSELENVIMTPHTASATTEARTAMSIMTAEGIIDFLKGVTPKYLV